MKANELRIGDVIIEGQAGNRKRTKVNKIEPCSQRGVPKVHINGDKCYDTLADLWVGLNSFACP
jgi:hypothetical protein